MPEKDEMLEVLDDILDNGTPIPARVSNRMLLAAIRKNYKTSTGNTETLAETGKTREVILATHLPRVDELEQVTGKLVEYCDNLSKERVGILADFITVQKTIGTVVKIVFSLCIVVSVLVAAITWHTGIDIGWFPPLP